MDSPDDDDVKMTEGGGNTRNKQPFTFEENIHQLNDIDEAVVQLMTHASKALSNLTSQKSDPASLTEQDSESKKKAQKDDFKTSTNAFLATLHEVDVKMKRQIFALEEAGIVSLASGQRTDQGPPKASLNPDGKGNVGNLNVGWLNSRGTRVERDMEAELWGNAKEFLKKQKETTTDT